MSFRPFRALAALGLVACVPAAQAEVFINEIHYDNAGTDSGERIEVVATAGESLSGWRIHLYNGTGSTTAATAYDNDPLPTGALATCGGANVRFATLSYAANGMQNGFPELVNEKDTPGIIAWLARINARPAVQRMYAEVPMEKLGK